VSKTVHKTLEFEIQCFDIDGTLSAITVPTEELALIAVKAALDNGNLSITISKVYK
jgi:hypothetical protein